MACVPGRDWIRPLTAGVLVQEPIGSLAGGAYPHIDASIIRLQSALLGGTLPDGTSLLELTGLGGHGHKGQGGHNGHDGTRHVFFQSSRCDVYQLKPSIRKV
jgi:hypothetical protein